MKVQHFASRDLFAGNRFLAPLSEQALLEAGRAAGLQEGATVLELGCGNGAVSVFLAEEFHVYARGVDTAAELVELALQHAERSPAGKRLRFFHEDPAAPSANVGPVDFVCALRGEEPVPEGVQRPGGRCLLGRYVIARRPAPAEVVERFPMADREFQGEILWGREATPLEWERFYGPQERALRVYRRGLSAGERMCDFSLEIERRIETFRRHSSYLAYQLLVLEL